MRLSLFAPCQYPDGPDFFCKFFIEGLDDTKANERQASGVDAIQALYIAMQMAHALLVSSSAYQEGRLSWFGTSELGLPVLDGVRHLMKATI